MLIVRAGSLSVACVALVAFVACHADDRGFDIVRVPLSAYPSPDAAQTDGAHGVETHDGGGGAEPVVLCVSQSEAKKDEDSDECAEEFHGRGYDEKATTRHRAKGDDSTVCCYRRGRVLPRGHHDDDD